MGRNVKFVKAYLQLREENILQLKRITIYIIFTIVCFFAYITGVWAQGKQRVIQFSGLVVSGSSEYGVPGVNIYIPKAGRGTSTNQYGYFSLPVLAGDSAVISAISYKKQYYIIPDDERQSVSVVIYLKEDTTMLPVIEIFPYPTEALFKEAFLALKLPETDLDNMKRNLNEKVMARIADEIGMSGNANFRNHMNQQYHYQHNKNFAPTMPFTNPFAWADLIRSIKRGDFKKAFKKDDD